MPDQDVDDSLWDEPFGKHVAWLDDEEILSADTYDELRDRLDQMPVDQSKVVIGWVQRPDVIRLGFGLYRIVVDDPDEAAPRNVSPPSGTASAEEQR